MRRGHSDYTASKRHVGPGGGSPVASCGRFPVELHDANSPCGSYLFAGRAPALVDSNFDPPPARPARNPFGSPVHARGRRRRLNLAEVWLATLDGIHPPQTDRPARTRNSTIAFPKASSLPLRLPPQHFLDLATQTPRYSGAKAERKLAYVPRYSVATALPRLKAWAEWSRLIGNARRSSGCKISQRQRGQSGNELNARRNYY